MIRSLQTALALALRAPSLSLTKQSLLACRVPLIGSSLLSRPVAYFSQEETTTHPLLNLLSTVSEDKLDQPLADILKLNTKNKEKALYTIISRVAKDSLPPRILLHPTFQAHLQNFPLLEIRALLLRVDGQLQQLDAFIQQNNEDGKKVAVKDINSCFSTVFANFKKVPSSQLETLQAEACKSFADYHYEYLLKLVDHRRAKEVLKKALQFYKASLTKYMDFLKEKEEQAEEQAQQEEAEDLSKVPVQKMTAQQREEMIKTIDYIRYDIAESYCEVLFKVIEVQNYLTDPRIKSNRTVQANQKIPFAYHSGLHSLLPLFQPVIRLYSSSEIRHQSLFYYKMAKAYLELKYYFELETKAKNSGEEMEKITIAFQNVMDQLTQEIVGVLQIMPYNEDTLSHQEGLCEVLLGIKSNRLSRMGLSKQEFETTLVQDIKEILEMIKVDGVRKLITANFSNVLYEVMEIDLQKHLGKLPRSTRLPGRLRRKKSA